jgi:hypothetical protein
VVFHIPGSVLKDAHLLAEVYGKMGGALQAMGVPVRFLVHDRVNVPREIEADRGFHILDHGRTRHPRVLNCGSAYISPFRYLDPWGIRAFSSIAGQVFDAKRIPFEAAHGFHARLVKRLVETRRSRYHQPETSVPVPANCIAVFLQTEQHRSVGETCYLSMREMVLALLARTDPRPIVIKPHPRDVDFSTLDWLANLVPTDARLHIIPANIHDILEACDVVVTINSAVGIEAMVHSKPVVLCGHCDFHHCAETAKQISDLDGAIARAEATEWPFAAFLTWFYRRKCIDPRSETLGQHILARISHTGFDVSVLGVSIPPLPFHQ